MIVAVLLDLPLLAHLAPPADLALPVVPVLLAVQSHLVALVLLLGLVVL